MDAGSKTSHAVIVARSMKIPSVVGLRNLTTRVKNGEWAIVDGYDGLVILHGWTVNRRDRQLVENRVRQLPGVERVSSVQAADESEI